ncbi:hypothetical protein N7478_009253 [Penicillium angulare]|uniref:uncharacterized protein n=1 Tax=Penicillium angulare TaxID=116970 RepID=UPI00254138BA|nr:uncharacterized protein N7478_009253 [Penicillium angulare]KAJ5274128.1 hypothetical protein N7478_009253 [Penicillium angulare]
MSLTSKKKSGPRKLQTKQFEPVSDGREGKAVPATPSSKSMKKSPGASEQRRPISSPNDDVSQASGSAAPLGRAASERSDKVWSQSCQAKDIARKGENTLSSSVPPDVSTLKGLQVAKGGQICDSNGNPMGKVVEGDSEDLVGQTVGDNGEIFDEDGELIGRVDVLDETVDQPMELPGEEQSKLDQAKDVVNTLEGLDGLPVSEGGMIKNSSGLAVGKVVEGDPEDLVGYTVNGEGGIVDDEGDDIGRAELIPVEEQSKLDQAKDVVNTLEGLDGLPVSEGGMIKNSSGLAVGKVVEGDPEDLVGYTVNGEGGIVDDEGDDIGRAELIPVEEQQQQQQKSAEETADDASEEDNKTIPSIESLEGLKCNKRGYIMDEATGKPVGEIIEGDPKKLSKLGAELDTMGQFWDNRGNVIGKAQPIPVYNDEEGGPFAGLDGLVVGEDGWVEDENQTRVGRLIEGDAKKLVNRAVDEDGEVLDRYGNVIARAERWEEAEAPEEEPIDLSSMEGLSCNKAGYVIGPEGSPIGRIIDGNPKELAGKKIFEGGEIYEGKNIVGRAELIPEDEREDIPDGPFAGFESLVVTKDGFIEDENGDIVGQLIEGDAKKLRGHAVDEDGEITDKYGNVKGRGEPYEPPEEEPPAEEDLSILEGKVVNKQGNIVDPATGDVFGRVIEGDKRLTGCKVDGQGQIWGDNGKVVGRAGLIPDAEQEEKEGQFYSFNNAEVGKDGVVVDTGRVIGRLIEGDAKYLYGRKVDEDGDVVDKNGNTIGKAERWEPEDKQRDVNPMSGRKITKEGEVRDADGNLIGKLTSGNLATLVGKTVNDNGYVVDNDDNKIGECTLLENIPEPEPEEEGPTAEELEAQAKTEEDRQIAEKMINILSQTLDRVKPQIEKAERTPKEELDEEKLVQAVKPLLEEGGRILQECNGSIRALDPDGRIAATAKARASSRDATPEEYQLADLLKELSETVTKTIDNGRKRIADMPHAKKKLNPLWALLSEPLFQIIAAVGLLLSGVLGLVGKLLGGLGLGGLLDGLLGGLGLDKLFEGLGLGGKGK